MINSLPESAQKKMKLKANQFFFKPYQVEILVDFFGDFESGRFIEKRKFARLYGCTVKAFKQVLIDEFGENSPLISSRKYYSPKEQMLIIKKIGKY